MRRLFALMLSILPLSACIDADLTLDFKDAETVEVTTLTKTNRQFFDMTGQSAEASCADGEGKIEADVYTCQSKKEMTLEAFLAEAEQKGASASLGDSLGEGIKVEKLDDTRLRLTFDMAGAMGEQQQAAELKEMADVLRAGFAGHSIVMRIKAAEIIETTGTLSEDGKSAEYVLPLTALLDAEPPKPFVTTFELESCTLWIFC